MTSYNPSTSFYPSLQQILADRHRWQLCWEEPFPALSKEGERTATRRIYTQIDDAIDAQRYIVERHSIVKPYTIPDDSQLLLDFITAHDAWVVRAGEEHKS